MQSGRHAAIVGSTATGKSQVALAIASSDAEWEIVTVDSMQVYRGMDIGTAKPTAQERLQVPHHVIDVADPWDDYDLASFQRDANAAIAEIEGRGRRALLVGGTALYLRALTDDLTLPGRFPEVRAELETEANTDDLHARLEVLDPEAASRMEPTNRRRVIRALEVTLGSGRPFSSFGPGLDAHPPTPFTLVALRWERARIDERIAQRYRRQMASGFLAEVDSLVAGDRPLSRTAAQALGYKELADTLAGHCSVDEALEVAVQRTKRFARRQEKWFRRDPRIQWVDVDEDPGAGVEPVRQIIGRRAQ